MTTPLPGFARGLATAGTGRALDALRHRLAVLNEQTATGLRVNRASDDPTAFAEARRLDALEARHEGYLGSIGASRLWVDQTAIALDTLVDFSGEAHELALQGLNGTLSQDDLDALADRVDALLASSVDQLNAKSDGEYLFAGNNTLAPPFNADGTPTSAGLDGRRVRRIGASTELAVNVPGDRIQDVGGFTATEALRDLAAALRGDGPVSLEEASERVAASRDHFIALGAENGVVGNRLTEAEAQVREATLVLQSRRSAIEEADFLVLATDLQRTQGHLEAALSTTAALQQVSLLDYLR